MQSSRHLAMQTLLLSSHTMTVPYDCTVTTTMTTLSEPASTRMISAYYTISYFAKEDIKLLKILSLYYIVDVCTVYVV
jgi:hypothetical protein